MQSKDWFKSSHKTYVSKHKLARVIYETETKQELK